ncbi:DUF3150 domain-containing protein [Allochromatium tepidum]|uniref:DUF3150 domain-containing protein n=1 Tax=Allochromatium tepidum TaxID=553982 RepID=A0ABN6GED6_9GAMM|nr:DUF3150 domain-containing protein [Allochromatium tepidum]BCU08331.1 hypothetical protein Atep_30080 [Allochromatium tepidum]
MSTPDPISPWLMGFFLAPQLLVELGIASSHTRSHGIPPGMFYEEKVMTDITVLRKLNVVSIDISSWSGGANLKKEDIGVDIPDRAFSLGRKYLIAPERISPFSTIRRRARERCLKVGTRFVGGFAIPAEPEVMEALTSDLEEMRLEFESRKAQLLREFFHAVDEWVEEPEVAPYEELIRASLPSLRSIERRIQFRYSIFQIGAAESAPVEPLEAEVSALRTNLFTEVAEDAGQLYKSFVERNLREGLEKLDWNFGSRKTLHALTNLRNKLKGLEFLDPRIPPVVDEIDRTVKSLPEQGKLEGAAMRNLCSLLIILSDDQRMLQLGEGLLNVSAVVQEEFGNLLQRQAEEVKTPTASETTPSNEEENEFPDVIWEEADMQSAPPVMPTLDVSSFTLDF